MTNINLSNQVNVLLSTYNGEAFLHDQLQSLYQQTYQNIKIYVRDDGSSDSTLDILQKEVLENRLSLQISEANIGPAASFLRLLDTSGDAGFYAFCDQDDIWLPNKIEMGVDVIKKSPSEIPIMYFSRQVIVNARNQFIKLSPLPRCIGFGNALVENVAIGCTVVLNKAARDLIIKSTPDRCLMHDSWCYLLISCMGNVVFDPKTYIHYRQHSLNAIGASTSLLQTIYRRIRRFRIAKYGTFRFTNQAEIFLKLYSDIIPESKCHLLQQLIEGKQSFKVRIKLALSKRVWRQSAIDNFILRLLILINRY